MSGANKMKRFGLIMIGHFKPDWLRLAEEEQAGLAARMRRAAQQAGVTPVLGYTLSTQGSFLEIWEADDKAKLDAFLQKLDALGYKKYYDQVLMQGERAPEWIQAPSEQDTDVKR